MKTVKINANILIHRYRMVVKNALLTTNGVEKQIAAIFGTMITGIPVGPGLIVGQRSSASQCNDHAIYLARTPLPDDININNVSALELQKKLGGDNIDVDWMCEHVKQVNKHFSCRNYGC